MLNEIHGVNYSVRYWRIVVGWWLFYFAQIFFDRWQVIRAASEAHPCARMLRMPAEPSVPASSDMTEFLDSMTGDAWNERLSADIAERWTCIQVEVAGQASATVGERKKEVAVGRHTHTVRRRIYTRVTRVMDWFGRRRLFSGESVALHSDYLRRPEKVKLALMLRQLPSMDLPARLPRSPVDPEQRKWVLTTPGADELASALVELIPAYLPACYLEGYAEAAKLAEASGSMRRPRVIMTANAFSSDDCWKLWAGREVENGAKLVIAQHGGHYGAGAWSATQMHEIAISDRYLSWGWSDAAQAKVHPAPATKLIGMKRRPPSQEGRCLQVTSSLPRSSYWMYSVPVGHQFAGYLEDQLRFAAALSDEVRQNLAVRLYSQDYGWDIADRWGDAQPSVVIDSGDKPIQALLADTRLYVATYNATTFLESFTQGIPTVMFWNPEHWELSEDALPFFTSLRRASVLFDDPVSCAGHINSIWSDVPSWWAMPEVQSAVESFSQQFAYTGPKPLRELKRALTQW
jgi:putative transferase (TIGR04331 family)